jgi:hypothetical protein
MSCEKTVNDFYNIIYLYKSQLVEVNFNKKGLLFSNHETFCLTTPDKKEPFIDSNGKQLHTCFS